MKWCCMRKSAIEEGKRWLEQAKEIVSFVSNQVSELERRGISENANNKEEEEGEGENV